LKPAAPIDATAALNTLEAVDADLADQVARCLAGGAVLPTDDLLTLMVADTLWALSHESAFGRAVAMGYAGLMTAGPPAAVMVYHRQLRAAGDEGPGFGWLMATHLAPVLKTGHRPLVRGFFSAVSAMRAKGVYTLSRPLAALGGLIEEEIDAAVAFLNVLRAAFGQRLRYNQSLRLSVELPRAVLRMAAPKRLYQLVQLERVVRLDFRLAEPFLAGLEQGSGMLDAAGLARFVGRGLDDYRHNREKGRRFLSLASHLGRSHCGRLQTTVSLDQFRPTLLRYLGARLGRAVSLAPLGSCRRLAREPGGAPLHAATDGRRCIYVPGEISVGKSRKENERHYMRLVRLEAGLIEFDTMAFDLERMASEHPCALPADGPQGAADQPDLVRFWNGFEAPDLARDLFTLIEHGRLRCLTRRRYPGLQRRMARVLTATLDRMADPGRDVHPLTGTYARIALGRRDRPATPIDRGLADDLATELETALANDAGVHSVGLLTSTFYRRFADNLQAVLPQAYRPMTIPLGRRLQPELHLESFGRWDRLARRLQAVLAGKGAAVFKNDLRKRLDADHGRLSRNDLVDLAGQDAAADVAAAWTQVDALLKTGGAAQGAPDDCREGECSWHREWSCELADYLPAHVRVADRRAAAGAGSAGFYADAMTRHAGLVRQVRTCFELMKPEGLAMMRQWVEGDDFDYRAMLDFAVDRKAGLLPSDRLYVKRIKQQRDVAVHLLMDLSRSTAHPVAGTERSVLAVEKEAIVLLCEALEVVGDRYAIAGFSGNGRLGVDYYRVKDFDEPLGNAVKQRIGGLRPQRSTRMGAAVRHACRQMDTVPASVRLLMVLGDGFPNDVGYKGGYAIADTRQALFEAHSQGICVHAITVNAADQAAFDPLYGTFHHSVIGDVRALPNQLLRLYAALTRH
jgi:nitric oxide reductase NorD protein